MSATLCSPGKGLSCFACCPPIRPPGYEHIQYRSSLIRQLSENRAEFLSGHLPSKPVIGFFCPGLGFLDSKGRQAGCLLHPLRNQGRDLRELTGYRDKCARETCPPFRAFAALEAGQRDALLELCQGMDCFTFSSREQNPLMRLLAFGPQTSARSAELGLADLEELASLEWLDALSPWSGWFLGLACQRQGGELLRKKGLAVDMRSVLARLSAGLGGGAPLDNGRPLVKLCDEWEAAFWLGLLGRKRARADEFKKWRKSLESALASF